MVGHQHLVEAYEEMETVNWQLAGANNNYTGSKIGIQTKIYSKKFIFKGEAIKGAPITL